MNKKGFTLVELLATIVIIGILGGLATSAYYKYLDSARDKTFKMAEETLIDNMEAAYADCLTNSTTDFCISHPSFNVGDKFTLEELINSGYSEKTKNPYKTDEYCDFQLSYVQVLSKNNVGFNTDISYKACLVCGDKRSSNCD